MSNKREWKHFSSVPLLIVVLAFACRCEAKFEHVYKGIAQDGLQACLEDPIYSFSKQNITLRGNARGAFACVMNNIDNSQQSILSSGASILGLIPTALALLGNRRSEIMAIHARLPILAFLLTLTGISVDYRVQCQRLKTEPQPISIPKKSTSTRFFDVDERTPLLSQRILIFIHVVAALAVTAIVWQTCDLSQRAVLSWACWTSFYPLAWLFLGPFHHLCEVVTDALSDEVWPTLKPVFTFLADLLGKFQFLAGTAVFAGLALVSGQNAVKVLAVYGIVAVFMRECAAWTIQVLGTNSSNLG